MITRPDGRPYRPRKPGLRAHAWEDDYESGVVVFGTLDPTAAAAFALDSAAYWYGSGAVVDPVPGWYRDAFNGWGERCWITDERRGAPGVVFTSADALPVVPLDVQQLRAGESAGAE